MPAACWRRSWRRTRPCWRMRRMRWPARPAAACPGQRCWRMCAPRCGTAARLAARLQPARERRPTRPGGLFMHRCTAAAGQARAAAACRRARPRTQPARHAVHPASAHGYCRQCRRRLWRRMRCVRSAPWACWSCRLALQGRPYRPFHLRQSRGLRARGAPRQACQARVQALQVTGIVGYRSRYISARSRPAQPAGMRTEGLVRARPAVQLTGRAQHAALRRRQRWVQAIPPAKPLPGPPPALRPRPGPLQGSRLARRCLFPNLSA